MEKILSLSRCQTSLSNEPPLPLILDYILQLKWSGLSTSSVHIHLAAITAFHSKIEGHLIFTHPMTKGFLKDLQNLYLEVWEPTPPWNLSLIFRCLTSPPFESMVTCSNLHQSMKMAFLVVITSTQQLGEIGAQMAYPHSQSSTKIRSCYDHTESSYPRYCPISV